MDKNELKTLNQELKKVPSEKRPIVRRMLSADIPLADALTVVNAFILSDSPTSQNKTIYTDQVANIPYTAEKSENKAVNAPENISLSNPQEDKLERVPDAGDLDLNEIKQKIQALIDNFCEIYNIDDLTKAPQRQFTALSTYIGDNLFKGTKLLKDTTLYNNGSCMPTTGDRYNWDKVACMVSLYITLCNLYNKAFLFDGIAAFLSMSENTLKDNNDKLTQRGIDIYKKHEDMLAVGIIDGKQSPVGVLAHLNHYHNWTTGTTHTEKKETVIIYPSLSSDLQNNSPRIATI